MSPRKKKSAAARPLQDVHAFVGALAHHTASAAVDHFHVPRPYGASRVTELSGFHTFERWRTTLASKFVKLPLLTAANGWVG